MKILYGIITIIFFYTSPDFFPQVKSADIIPQQDGYNINLVFKPEPFSIKDDVIKFKNVLNEGKPGQPQLPHKVFFIAIPPYSKVTPQVINKKENIIENVSVGFNPEIYLKEDRLEYKESSPDLNYFTEDIYPPEEVSISGYTWIRDYYCAAVRINTHHYNWKKKELIEITGLELNIILSEVKPYRKNFHSDNEFEKVLSNIILNYEYADELKSFQNPAVNDTSGNWIDYGKDYVKLAVSEDGIYKITYDDLLNYGVNPSVNPLTFKVFFKGKEIPLYISGEDDFSFDTRDYIEFYAEKNYGSPDYKEIVPVGIDYKNYFNRYNNTSFIWLTWGNGNGLRADSIQSIIPGITDSVKNHIVKIHLEKDERLWYYDASAPRVQLPGWQENKVWTWQIIGNGGVLLFTFDTPDFVPNTIINTTTRLISNAADVTSNAHSVGAGLNSSTPSDTVVYSFKQTINFSTQHSSDILNQTENGYRVFGLPTQAGFHQSLIDWVDIDYFRFNKAVNDSLMITIPDSVTSSVRIISVENVSQTNDLYLYKIKPELKRITAYNYSSGNITFSDTVRGGDKYLIIKNDHKKNPRFVTKKQFVNLRDNLRVADYIIISNKELSESANQYKNFIETNYQLNTELVFIDDIYDEFSFGSDNAGAVRDFLFAANQYWQSPKPSYLNLIGDANYDYRQVIIPQSGTIRKNLVPSYGNPVSDTWFVMWDSTEINIPQMFVGRIPAANNDEVLFYLQKHQIYINRQYDEWNKNYLFFSGGDINNSTQLAQIKNANDNLLHNLVKPKPVGGVGIHFYKTTNPVTNFGPYSLSEVRDAIDYGALFISYIGHSGTQTWDNGITSTADLKNIYSDRKPLISDFGCSTGKFAEPDIDAFGELFLLENPNGQAINYLGNSSWGYLSTSLRFPDIFYRNLLIDTLSSVGEAHLLSKIQQFNVSGISEVNRVFNYCNILFGDPVISFSVPPKPNLSIKESSFSISGSNPNDMTDSVTLKIEILNTGKVPDDSVSVSIIGRWFDDIIFQSEKIIPLPLFKDTIDIIIPVEGRVGQHKVEVELDPMNSLDEIYENDNYAQFVFTVFSTSVRPIDVEKYYTTSRESVKVLNTSISPVSNEISIAVSDNPEFENERIITKNIDTVFTTFDINNLMFGLRYWWKGKVNVPQQEWSDVYSFFNVDKNFTWYIGESFRRDDIEFNNSAFDTTDNSFKLTKTENLLEVVSAGYLDGSYASIFYNGQEQLPNTFFWGIGTAEIDSTTLRPSNFRFFIFEDGNATDLMIAYLDSIPQGQMLVMTISTDGAQSVLGFSGGTPVRRAIENFGSLYIDSVRYRDSWCIIGKKGAATGTVPESFQKSTLGFAETSLSNIVNNQNGFIIFPAANKSYEWINIEKDDFLPPGSSIEYIPLGIRSNDETDTLAVLNFLNNISSLSHIDASVYSSIKILTKLNANNLFESPSINSLGINYNTLTELAINYQVVNVDSDTLTIGEEAKLNFGVYNASETPADSFKILVEVLKSNNEREIISHISVDNINPLDKKFFEVSLNTMNYPGNNFFMITADYENRIPEIFEDNNFFQIPFYVKPDTSTPWLNITFDGVDIFDGDFVSSNPEIKIELNDPSFLPINDTSAVTLFLNDEQIYFAGNPEISFQFNPANPKVVITYKPELNTGGYFLKVFGKNSIGNFSDSTRVEKYFIVNEETEILYIYNYPNPSRGETYFTFKLTQIPDELRIKIYTVAGRQVKEIIKTSSELKFDFNTIHWDGKDDDKNIIANGVYFYRVVISNNGKSRGVTQKMAIVR